MSPTASAFVIGLGVLVAFPLLLAGMFALVGVILSAIGGWGRLARHFRAGSEPLAGRHLGGLSGMVGPVSYRYTLSATVGSEGIRLSVMPLFRAGHPHLFIPYAAMSEPRPRKLLWWDLVAVEVGRPRIATLSLPATLLDAVLPADRDGPASEKPRSPPSVAPHSRGPSGNAQSPGPDVPTSRR